VAGWLGLPIIIGSPRLPICILYIIIGSPSETNGSSWLPIDIGSPGLPLVSHYIHIHTYIHTYIYIYMGTYQVETNPYMQTMKTSI
jgi:hypothetical protein